MDYALPACWRLLVAVAAVYYGFANWAAPTAVVAPCGDCVEIRVSSVIGAGVAQERGAQAACIIQWARRGRFGAVLLFAPSSAEGMAAAERVNDIVQIQIQPGAAVAVVRCNA